jgi:hypothetical protein
MFNSTLLSPTSADIIILSTTPVDDFYAAVAAMKQGQLNPKLAFFVSINQISYRNMHYVIGN